MDFSNKVFIDGEDAEQYGLYIQPKGLIGLVSFPPMKKVYTQEWAEESGLDCDLSAPVLDSREFDLKIGIQDDDAPLAFKELAKKAFDGNYHDWYFKQIGRTYRLRYVSQGTVNFLKDLPIPSQSTERPLKYVGLLTTVRMADDFPLRNYTYQAPNITQGEYNRFKNLDSNSGLDDLFFYHYGAIVLNGSLADLFKHSEMKTALVRDISVVPGKQMLSQFGTTKGRTVKINLLMQTTTLEKLWRSYDALLYNVSKAGEHTLRLKKGTMTETAKVYYKQAQVTEFDYKGNKMWLQFSITFQTI